MNHLHLEPNFLDTDYALMFPADVSPQERKDMLELHRLRERILEIASKYEMFGSPAECSVCNNYESSRSKSDSIV